VTLQGRIYKAQKKPREQYIRDMQTWMHGKLTTEVVGIKDYTKPRSGKTAKFNNTELLYHIRLLHSDTRKRRAHSTGGAD